MRTWEIKVLYLGRIEGKISSWYPVGMPPLEEDATAPNPYFGLLLRSEDEDILVDNGVNDRFIIDGKAWGGLPADTGGRFVRDALAKEGLKPEDIKTVVYTHLHNDHAGNCGMFPDATHIFQRDEWTNLLNPLPVQMVRRDYDLDVIPELKTLKTLRPDGDLELREGIKLYKTPGHTLGSQSVAINTRKGIVVYIGDLSHYYCTLFPQYREMVDLDGVKHPIPKAPDTFGPVIPTSLVYDYYAFYDSIYKVKAIASRDEPGYILPGHEPTLVLPGAV